MGSMSSDPPLTGSMELGNRALEHILDVLQHSLAVNRLRFHFCRITLEYHPVLIKTCIPLYILYYFQENKSLWYSNCMHLILCPS